MRLRPLMGTVKWCCHLGLQAQCCRYEMFPLKCFTQVSTGYKNVFSHLEPHQTTNCGTGKKNGLYGTIVHFYCTFSSFQSALFVSIYSFVLCLMPFSDIILTHCYHCLYLPQITLKQTCLGKIPSLVSLCVCPPIINMSDLFILKTIERMSIFFVFRVKK